VEDLAETRGMTSRHLSRLFAEHAGVIVGGRDDPIREQDLPKTMPRTLRPYRYLKVREEDRENPHLVRERVRCGKTLVWQPRNDRMPQPSGSASRAPGRYQGRSALVWGKALTIS
jgi:hypothetical protein